MITQIYSIQTVEEALGCAAAGADYIGIASGTKADLPAEISLEEGLAIFAALKGKAKRVAIAVADEAEPILEMVKQLQPEVVHICGNNYKATPDFCEKVKKIRPGIAVEQAIAITGHGAVAEAVRYGEYCDTLILDSVDPSIAGIGAAGVVNDWNICAEIIRQTACRVIVAGGLGPDNVAEAIRQTRPWGVDSLTKTSIRNSDGTMKKDLGLVRDFINNAQKAAVELGL